MSASRIADTEEVVQLLIEKGAEGRFSTTCTNGLTALMFASRNKDTGRL